MDIEKSPNNPSYLVKLYELLLKHYTLLSLHCTVLQVFSLQVLPFIFLFFFHFEGGAIDGSFHALGISKRINYKVEFLHMPQKKSEVLIHGHRACVVAALGYFFSS